MIWIILVIIVVGYFIVKAINRSTVNNAVIAQQQHLNSPEYKKQAQADMAYFSYLSDEMQWQIEITKNKIDLLQPPEIMRKSEYRLFGKTKVLWTNFDKVITNKSEIIDNLKLQLKYHKKCLEEAKEEYEDGKKEYMGYYPTSLEAIRVKYELGAPFPPDENYFNEDKTSSWSMHEEKQKELHDLSMKLKSLEEKTRKPTHKKLVNT